MEQVTLQTHQLNFKWERNKGTPGGLSLSVLASVAKLGVVNPLLVVRAHGQTFVWIGNQRLAAARELGIAELPCIVVESEAEALEAMAAYKEIS